MSPLVEVKNLRKYFPVKKGLFQKRRHSPILA